MYAGSGVSSICRRACCCCECLLSKLQVHGEQKSEPTLDVNLKHLLPFEIHIVICLDIHVDIECPHDVTYRLIYDVCMQ